MLRFPRAAAAAAALLSLAACNAADDGTQAGNAAIPDVSIPDISLKTMQDVVGALASDEFEGRAPGTEGEEKTVGLLIERFKAAGLEPGNNGSWTQDVPLVEMTADKVSPLSFTGGKAPLSLAFGTDFVAGSYRVQPNISIKDSDVVFVGYGINAPEKGWNDYAGLDVKGKTVVILVNDPDWEAKEAKGEFNGRAMTYYGRWPYKYEEAARQGAAAALIVHDTEPAAYGWNVVQSSWTGTQYLAASENNGADQTAANGWIQLGKAKQLFADAGLDFDKLRADAKKKGFKPVALTGVKASLSFDNKIERKMSKNVIAVLPGAKRPDEYVLYTAHWDHLGKCEAVDGDGICNGAIDNATGTAALVAIAEAQKKAGAPDRSLVFLAVTAEESGLLGSKYYADNPVFPLARTVGGVNMDALSGAGAAKDIVVVGRGKSELEAYLAKAVAMEKRTIVDEPTPEKGFYYRSDHFSFAKRGVPMIYFDGGENLVEGGTDAGKAWAEAYTAKRYHAPSDDMSAITSWDGMMADLRLYYAVGRMLAMTTAWPNWNEGDEFRKARDESRKGA
ncbi:MAG: M28 family metallopeptidase [Sphingopyxis sp.]|uniref:M28 family metallopeptidase n=1 Tax=Sphingopyxis sp. TaxID=1908224 RepID=UPI002ABA0924|nr:M28 family metallopeptidase [Sphingopyxis sp.]MDZ3831461.1 M28 family metallopeptidase [Sphingopyxis sp.]